MNLPARITIREVGARDGLQSEAPLDVDDRLELLDALLIAGVTHLEVAAFVSPAAVPAMAGAADVVAGLGAPEGVVRAALVPNVRGAELALAAGIDELTVTISASATYNQRNVRMSIDESLAAIAAICVLAGPVPVDAVISCAFGSPYEGDSLPADVALLAERLRASGASAVTLADTTGMATPRRIDDVLLRTGTHVGLHLHDTRGTGLLNLYAGLQAGVVRFDTSVGGLGGSPFAAGAAGNVATEEAVALCDDLGVHTGIGIEAIIEAALLVERLVGHQVPSRVAHAGPRSRRAGA
ncbi:MAG: hydroxymethylglutaryl-CoA lyase [Ilumatobacteraceae bacterium]|jgi:hydroxymethylglutaryl-CoA lyase|nr:hydroxymethylglutaryl-CoA lyase [Ilumatobacteraceae bacterium]MBP8210732.1 hydroxymethylglutaryl-CoA lyase [Ilumatobacteraceae bacterium]MBP9051132.1 hydroxymethylglutaryl-CoA lyase [Ilumatobacteraceae bacterium]HQY16043.1 hydroxymethylglutaryl-CoA lyase [Ilumatobacteraceae bacterium]HQY86320.1 hydroxymethylglutaryl-CoA lyase [Ilumatobacteraceae bacterium]